MLDRKIVQHHSKLKNKKIINTRYESVKEDCNQKKLR